VWKSLGISRSSFVFRCAEAAGRKTDPPSPEATEGVGRRTDDRKQQGPGPPIAGKLRYATPRQADSFEVLLPGLRIASPTEPFEDMGAGRAGRTGNAGLRCF
jgi:hypothetical protein